MAKKKSPDAVAGPNLQMEFRLVPVSKINPAKYNPRKDLVPADAEYQNIKRSIEVHGLADPLIWNEHNGVLIGGHQRLKILINEFHANAVWCSVRKITDEKEEMSLNNSLNKVQGEWDFLKLKDVLARYEADAADSPLRAAMGYSPLEFKGILQWLPQITTPDDLEQTPAERLGVYQEGAIKQIVLYFQGGKQYADVIARLEKVRTLEGIDDNTTAFLRLLENYENHRVAKTTDKQKTARRNGK